MLSARSLKWLPRFVENSSDRRAFIFSILFGFTIRLVPELLSYPNPIGFDTVYYAARIKSGIIWTNWTAVFSMWLFEGVLISVNQIVKMNPFLLLKLAAPLLYALNVCGIYHFSRKALNWSVKAALIASIFFAFQLASLRLSWDLDKTLLAMGILLFTLPLISNVETKRNFIMLLSLSLLLVVSHIMITAMLLAVVLATIIVDWLKGERRKSLVLLTAVLPAFAVLLVSLLVYPSIQYTPENVLFSQDRIHQSPGGIFFLVNYLGVSDEVQNYPTYLVLASHVLSLFSVLYLWWLPLVLVGFFRDRTLDTWTLLLLFGSFSALIVPFCAIDLWNRWMFALVYPFTFYAINGVVRVYRSRNESVTSTFRYLKWMKLSRKKTLGIFLVAVFVGSVFLIVPPFFDRFGVFSIPTTISYLPSTMLYSSVPLRDVKSTVNVIMWLNDNMDEGSVVLVHRAFFWWTDLYLDKKHLVLYFERDIVKALEIASEHGFDPIYMIWWNENYFTWQNQSIGWYGLVVPKYFKYSFSSDRVSVFIYSVG